MVILFYKDASLVIFFYKDVMWVYSFKAGKMQGNRFFFSKSAFRVLFILSYISGLFVFFSNAEDFLQFAFDSVFSYVLLVFMKIHFHLDTSGFLSCLNIDQNDCQIYSEQCRLTWGESLACGHGDCLDYVI